MCLAFNLYQLYAYEAVFFWKKHVYFEILATKLILQSRLYGQLHIFFMFVGVGGGRAKNVPAWLWTGHRPTFAHFLKKSRVTPDVHTLSIQNKW